MNSAVILLAAGRSSRMQGTVEDKILAPIAGRSAFSYSIEAFVKSRIVQRAVVVYRDREQRNELSQAVSDGGGAVLDFNWVEGGEERQDSVYNALMAIPAATEYVFIHDCARPLIRPESITQLYTAVIQDDAAVLAHRINDSIKAIPHADRLRKTRLKDIPRDNLWAMETPQAFSYQLIADAYRRVRYDNLHVTDDTAAAAHDGHPVTIVENRFPNPKLTRPEDIAYIDYLLRKRQEESEVVLKSSR